MEIRFIADNNVGKLARWLRLIGYDTVLLKQKDDNQMIQLALNENRVVLTKDAEFMKRRLVTSGRLKGIYVREDDPELQVQEVVKNLNLDCYFRPFSLCLECNRALLPRERERVKALVPPRVFETQTQFTQCPGCGRIYWPGTHWQAMEKRLQELRKRADRNRASA